MWRPSWVGPSSTNECPCKNRDTEGGATQPPAEEGLGPRNPLPQSLLGGAAPGHRRSEFWPRDTRGRSSGPGLCKHTRLPSSRVLRPRAGGAPFAPDFLGFSLFLSPSVHH